MYRKCAFIFVIYIHLIVSLCVFIAQIACFFFSSILKFSTPTPYYNKRLEKFESGPLYVLWVAVIWCDSTALVDLLVFRLGERKIYFHRRFFESYRREECPLCDFWVSSVGGSQGCFGESGRDDDDVKMGEVSLCSSIDRNHRILPDFYLTRHMLVYPFSIVKKVY